MSIGHFAAYTDFNSASIALGLVPFSSDLGCRMMSFRSSMAIYGLPYPYRPPEICRTLGNNIAVDDIKFDMWSFGIMTFNVMTGHLINKKVPDQINSWREDIYPVLLEAVQINSFRSLMSKAFPSSTIMEGEFANALNFVHFLLRLQPEDRPTAKQAGSHMFLMEGLNLLEKPDDIWIKKELFDSSTSSTSFTNSIRASKMKLHRYKFRKRYQITGMRCRKGRKWIKPGGEGKMSGVKADDPASDNAEKGGNLFMPPNILFDTQIEEEIYDQEIPLRADSKNENAIEMETADHQRFRYENVITENQVEEKSYYHLGLSRIHSKTEDDYRKETDDHQRFPYAVSKNASETEDKSKKKSRRKRFCAWLLKKCLLPCICVSRSGIDD